MTPRDELLERLRQRGLQGWNPNVFAGGPLPPAPGGGPGAMHVIPPPPPRRGLLGKIMDKADVAKGVLEAVTNPGVAAAQGGDVAGSLFSKVIGAIEKPAQAAQGMISAATYIPGVMGQKPPARFLTPGQAVEFQKTLPAAERFAGEMIFDPLNVIPVAKAGELAQLLRRGQAAAPPPGITRTWEFLQPPVPPPAAANITPPRPQPGVPGAFMVPPPVERAAPTFQPMPGTVPATPPPASANLYTPPPRFGPMGPFGVRQPIPGPSAGAPMPGRVGARPTPLGPPGAFGVRLPVPGEPVSGGGSEILPRAVPPVEAVPVTAPAAAPTPVTPNAPAVSPTAGLGAPAPVQAVTPPAAGAASTQGPLPVSNAEPGPAGNPVKKMISLIPQAKELRKMTEAERTVVRGQRFEAFGRIAQAGGWTPEAVQAGIGQLAGELPRAKQFEAIAGAFTPEDVKALFSQIGTSQMTTPDKLNASKAVSKMLSGEVPTMGELSRIQRVFGEDGVELVNAVKAKRTPGHKAGIGIADALGLPRALLTAIDASAPLRQGVLLAPLHPKEWAGNIPIMFKAMAKPEYAAQVDDIIRKDSDFDLWQRVGGRHADLAAEGAEAPVVQEEFASKVASSIPGVKGSERGYTTYMNKLRFDIFKTVKGQWEKAGKAATDEDYTELADLLNLSTGYARLGELERFAPILNIGFFSPRFMASRFLLPRRLLPRDLMDPKTWGQVSLAQKEAWKEFLLDIAVGASVLGVLDKSGLADVEIDPRSTDFGKIQIGPHRIDFWAGYQPIVRTISQLMADEYKQSGTGEYKDVSTWDTIGKFFRSKLAPTPGLGWNIAAGQNIAGEDVEATAEGIPEETFNLLAPMSIQTLKDAIAEDTIPGGFFTMPKGLTPGSVATGVATAVPSFLGASVSSYTTSGERRVQVAENLGFTPEQLKEEKELAPLFFEGGPTDEAEGGEKGDLQAARNQRLSDLWELVETGGASGPTTFPGGKPIPRYILNAKPGNEGFDFRNKYYAIKNKWIGATDNIFREEEDEETREEYLGRPARQKNYQPIPRPLLGQLAAYNQKEYIRIMQSWQDTRNFIANRQDIPEEKRVEMINRLAAFRFPQQP